MKPSLVANYHLGNKIFNLKDNDTNRDNCSYSIWLLTDVTQLRLALGVRLQLRLFVL